MTTNTLPVVALTLGDPAGIGPELIARLLADPATCAQANVVLVGDPWLWEDGQRIAGLRVATTLVANFAAVRGRADTSRPAFLAMDTVRPDQPRTTTDQQVGHGNDRPSPQQHSDHDGHGGQSWMMMLMCAPMLVVVIALVASGTAGVGSIVWAVGCMLMMALMMRGMGGMGGGGAGGK